jgi:hypothetical protein
MIPKKYTALGFDITKFGENSSVLRFNHKPVFVFSSNTSIGVEFLTHICDTYLKISEKRKDLTCIKA